MADTCLVEGTLLDPAGVPLPEAEVRFAPDPARWFAMGPDLVAPRPVRVVADAAGEVIVALLPGPYQVLTRSRDGLPYHTYGIVVPDAFSANLGDILGDLPLPPLNSVQVAVASAERARDDSAHNAKAAEESAALAKASAASVGGHAAAAEESAAAAAEDRRQTEADRIQTAKDRLATADDAQKTAEDRLAVGQMAQGIGQAAGAATAAAGEAVRSKEEAAGSASAAAHDAAAAGQSAVAAAEAERAAGEHAAATATDRQQTAEDRTATLNFGAELVVSATSTASGGEASVAYSFPADGPPRMTFALPRGGKGEQGSPGDAPVEFSGFIYRSDGLTVADGGYFLTRRSRASGLLTHVYAEVTRGDGDCVVTMTVGGEIVFGPVSVAAGAVVNAPVEIVLQQGDAISVEIASAFEVEGLWIQVDGA